MESLNPTADLGYQANRLARLLRATVAREIAPLGLTARQAAVVLRLAGAGTLTMSELAWSLGVDRPTLTGVVGRLARDGWLETSVDDTDRRSRLVSLTATALANVGALAEASGRASAAAFDGLSLDEGRQLLVLLSRASDGLESALSPDDRRTT
jgi:DNA-binding MarR family transcriptional regulator